MNTVIVPGAQKAATSSLNNYIDEHPECEMSSNKDSFYFSKDDNLKAPEAYYAGFESEPDQTVHVRGEACATYYWNPTVPERLRKFFNGSVRIIFLLRDPVDRAVSSYLHQSERSRDTRPIDEVFGYQANTLDEFVKYEEEELDRALETGQVDNSDQLDRLDYPRNPFRYVAMSRYSEFVSNFLDVFDRDEILFVLTEELAEYPEETFRRIESFLDVDDEFLPAGLGVRHNKSSKKDRSYVRWFLESIKTGIPTTLRTNPFLRRFYETLIGFQRRSIPPRLKNKLSRLFEEEVRVLSTIVELPFRKYWDELR